MNILMIGNSYTYVNALDQLLQELCRENGKQVNAWRVTKGGRRLEAYMDPEDETTQKLEAILQERRYDVCFLQEQSLTPILDYDAFLSGLTHVMRMVGKQEDRFLLYATWSRATGSTTLDAHSWTPEVMTHLLEDAYQKAGQQLEVPVSPVGTSFWKVVKAHPEIDLYDKDLTHPSYLGSCLAALTHYHTLFGHFPENASSLNLTADQLAIFRAAVCA